MTVSRETHQSGSELGRNVPVDRPQASHVVDDFLLGKECLSSVQNALSVQIAQAIKFWLPAAKTHLDFGVPSRGPLCRLVRCADAEQPFAELAERSEGRGRDHLQHMRLATRANSLLEQGEAVLLSSQIQLRQHLCFMMERVVEWVGHTTRAETLITATPPRLLFP
mgnify:FL=1